MVIILKKLKLMACVIFVLPATLVISAEEYTYVEINEQIIPGPVSYDDPNDINFTKVDDQINPTKVIAVNNLELPQKPLKYIDQETKIFTKELKNQPRGVKKYKDLSAYFYHRVDKKEDYTSFTKKMHPLKDSVSQHPVFQQGKNGVCVTYAVTAALNILYQNAENKISKICSLNLGQWLSKQSHDFFVNNKQNHPLIYNAVSMLKNLGINNYRSGWDGSYGYVVLSQLSTYGTVSNTSENLKQCGHPPKREKNSPKITEAPSALSPKTYQILQGKNKNYTWQTLCKPDKPCQRDIIEKIKLAIDKGNLVIISAVLPKIRSNATTFKYYPNLSQKRPDIVKDSLLLEKMENNVFAYTESLYECMSNHLCKQNSFGHAMMLYGYAEDPEEPGNGIFYLRNSWGKRAGDIGDYYMTYNYADKLLYEAYEIS